MKKKETLYFNFWIGYHKHNKRCTSFEISNGNKCKFGNWIRVFSRNKIYKQIKFLDECEYATLFKIHAPSKFVEFNEIYKNIKIFKQWFHRFMWLFILQKYFLNSCNCMFYIYLQKYDNFSINLQIQKFNDIFSIKINLITILKYGVCSE